MKTTPSDTQENKRKAPSFRVNTAPLSDRGAFQIEEAADYLSLGVTTIRRLLKRGLIKRIPGIRIIVITKAECDRFLREQTDIAQLAA
jgi:excisionase family DNA binding protein